MKKHTTLTTFLLVRHGAHALGGGIIAGRSPDVHLSDLGRQQAMGLVDRVAHLPIAAIYSSPMDRTLETARPLANHLQLEIGVRESLNEIDFGDWTGQTIEDLKTHPLWSAWNEFRSGTRIPGGESMLETQSRIVRELENLCSRHPQECVALFSHGDVIKSAVAYALGVPLDMFRRIEIGLASVSVIEIGDFGPWVLAVNNTARIELP